MSTSTPRCQFPYIAAGQAQKHVTHNEALDRLDTLLFLAVETAGGNAPPVAPAEGSRHIVGPAPTGAWAGQAHAIALAEDGLWQFLTPQAGWQAWHVASAGAMVFTGSDWQPLASGGAGGPAMLLGINTSADVTNRLAVASAASLFTHEGAGHQIKINKAGAADTASLLMQDGYSGRAELGLAGDDDFHLKVSADGIAWHEAMVISRTDGTVAFPSGVSGLAGGGTPGPNLLINASMAINQRAFAGGALAESQYGFDRWKAGTGGCTLTRAGNGAITLTGALCQIIEAPQLAGQMVFLSVENPDATLTVDVAGASGTITAGAGRRGLALTVPGGATGDVAVTLTGTGATFFRPLLTIGETMTAYPFVSTGADLLACQRYFCKTYNLDVAPGAVTTNGQMIANAVGTSAGHVTLNFVYPTTMRSVPTVTVYSPGSGLTGKMRRSDGTDLNTAFHGISERSAAIYNAVGTTSGSIHALHCTAQAEL
mgnify:CR=1 FL=1